eukprot:2004112-Amphidinium_carterae.1
MDLSASIHEREDPGIKNPPNNVSTLELREARLSACTCQTQWSPRKALVAANNILPIGCVAMEETNLTNPQTRTGKAPPNIKTKDKV